MFDTVKGQGRLVAIVVTHQRLEHIRTTLAALEATPPTDLSAMIVVDNQSTDGTAEMLARCADPRLIVLRPDRNLGGAGGFALGMRHAMAHCHPDWIVVMDDDARPHPEALARFHALDLSGYDGFAAAVRLPDGTPCDANRPTYNPFWHPRILLRALAGRGRQAFHLAPSAFDAPGTRRVDGASFVGFFVRADTVARHGYPDADLFIYGEDALYTLGLTKAGCRIAFDPAVCFEHDNQTHAAGDGRMQPLWKVYYHHRNQVFVYRMATGAFFLPVMLLYVPRWLWRMRAHRGERGAFLRLFWMALRDGFHRRTDRPHTAVLALAGRDQRLSNSR